MRFRDCAYCQSQVFEVLEVRGLQENQKSERGVPSLTLGFQQANGVGAASSGRAREQLLLGLREVWTGEKGVEG